MFVGRTVSFLSSSSSDLFRESSTNFEGFRILWPHHHEERIDWERERAHKSIVAVFNVSESDGRYIRVSCCYDRRSRSFVHLHSARKHIYKRQFVISELPRDAKERYSCVTRNETEVPKYLLQCSRSLVIGFLSLSLSLSRAEIQAVHQKARQSVDRL